MPERTIRVVYYTTNDGETHYRGDTVQLSDAEADRGDELGAFVGNQRQPGTDPVDAAFDNNPNPGPQGPIDEGGAPGGDQTVVSEMSDEEIDALTGQALDDAVEQAGIDASTGGSLSDGSLSADEKRDALKAQNAE